MQQSNESKQNSSKISLKQPGDIAQEKKLTVQAQGPESESLANT